MSNYNPYQGMESPFYPSWNQPFDRCSCGQPTACGNEHKQAVQVKQITRATRNGGQETISVVEPIGTFYANTAHRAFAVWDGHLALSDLNGPKFRQYQPPAQPYQCDRNASGSSLCASSPAVCAP